MNVEFFDESSTFSIWPLDDQAQRLLLKYLEDEFVRDLSRAEREAGLAFDYTEQPIGTINFTQCSLKLANAILNSLPRLIDELNQHTNTYMTIKGQLHIGVGRAEKTVEKVEYNTFKHSIQTILRTKTTSNRSHKSQPSDDQVSSLSNAVSTAESAIHSAVLMYRGINDHSDYHLEPDEVDRLIFMLNMCIKYLEMSVPQETGKVGILEDTKDEAESLLDKVNRTAHAGGELADKTANASGALAKLLMVIDSIWDKLT
jgi:hypothetical protein